MPLEIVRTPTRRLHHRHAAFIDELEHRWADTNVTVLIPELYVEHWWEHLLHNQSALVLKGRLLFRANTAVTSIPYGVRQHRLTPTALSAAQRACDGRRSAGRPRRAPASPHRAPRERRCRTASRRTRSAIAGWVGSPRPGDREHPAVVDAARAWTVLVDRAVAVDQHRAVPVLVVPHHHVTLRAAPARGTRSAAGTCASVSVSSGSMCTNCDDVQHAVHAPHGTSRRRRPACASNSSSHSENLTPPA